MKPLAAAWTAAALVAAAPSPSAEIARQIEHPAPGPSVVVLDRDVYENARADLADLRLVDDEGHETPYLLAHAGERPAPSLRPAMRDASFVRGRKAMVTLDFGAPTLKSHLTLALSGDNFRRRVTVEGRGRRDPEWATIVDQAWVFAVPAPAVARYETIALPENNHQFLRVTVMHGPDDPDRVQIFDAWAGIEDRRRPREVVVPARLTMAEDAQARETILTLDLGARYQPFRGIVLDVAAPRFWRGVGVEARVDPPPGQAGPPLAWTFLREGVVYRAEADGDVRESRRVEVGGRHRVLRVRIRNRDDAPLPIAGAVVMAPVERIVFEAAPGRRYRLTYGDPPRHAPSYDLARTVGDPDLFAARAREATLGPPVRTLAEAAAAPWTDRNPALLWAGLVAVVLALGALTRQALRST
jgi:uncharacterized protein DUF3999